MNLTLVKFAFMVGASGVDSTGTAVTSTKTFVLPDSRSIVKSFVLKLFRCLLDGVS